MNQRRATRFLLRGAAVVSAAVVAATASPATPAPTPTLDPEIDLDTPVVTGAVGDQGAAAAAWDGQGFLVAWRSPLWRSELRLARVTAAGEVLDPRGVAIDQFERDAGAAAVAAGGGGFVVVWSKDPNRVLAAHVTTASGRLVAEPAVLISEGMTEVRAGPVIAWHGSGFWVLWSRDGSGAGVYGARLSAEGRLMDPAPLVLAPAYGEPSLAWDGTRTLAAWSAAATAGRVAVRGVRLDGEGRAVDAQPLAFLDLPGDRPGPTCVARGGAGFLVAGAGITSTSGAAEIRAARVAPDGTTADGAKGGAGAGAGAGAGLLLAAAGGLAAGGPTCAWNGTGFAVLWSSQQAVAGKPSPRMTGSLVAVNGTVTTLGAAWSAAGQAPFLAATAADPFVFWSEAGWSTDEGLPTDFDIRGLQLPRDGASAATAPLISGGTNGQGEPVVASSGARLLVAWEDRREDRAGADVYAARLTTAGERLDPAGLPLGVGPGPHRAPAVAWDGSNFVVVWQQGRRGLGVARVTADGAVLDRPPLVVPGTEDLHLLSDPAICSDGDGILLAWGGRRAPPGGTVPAAADSEIRALRVPRGGSVKDAASFLVVPAADAASPPVMRLGCNGRAALLAWTGSLEPADGRPLLLAHLGRGSAAVTAPGPRVLQPREGDEWAGIGSDGQDFLVVWRNFDVQGRRRVVGVRVTGDGQLLDSPFRVVGNSNSGRRLTALWDGSAYLVLAINTKNDDPFELRGHRLSRDGVILDDDWFPVSYLATALGGTGTGSDGVLLPDGRSFLVYDRFFDDDATGNIRIRGRFVTPPPAAAPGPDAPSPDGGAGPDDAAPDDAATAIPPPASGGGCGCRLAGPGPAASAGSIPLLVAAAVALRRRRRKRSVSSGG